MRIINFLCFPTERFDFEHELKLFYVNIYDQIFNCVIQLRVKDWNVLLLFVRCLYVSRFLFKHAFHLIL